MSLVGIRWHHDRSQPLETYRLMQGTKQLAVVQAAGEGGWFWYAKGKSSGQRTIAKLEDAKAEALCYIREIGAVKP